MFSLIFAWTNSWANNGDAGDLRLDVKYSGKVDTSDDKIFLFKLFFLGFFSVCLPNIYFNILEYLNILDLLSLDKNDV